MSLVAGLACLVKILFSSLSSKLSLLPKKPIKKICLNLFLTWPFSFSLSSFLHLPQSVYLCGNSLFGLPLIRFDSPPVTSDYNNYDKTHPIRIITDTQARYRHPAHTAFYKQSRIFKNSSVFILIEFLIDKYFLRSFSYLPPLPGIRGPDQPNSGLPLIAGVSNQPKASGDTFPGTGIGRSPVAVSLK